MAWKSLGPTVEGVFGNEIYSLENNTCGGKVVRVVDGDTVKIQTPDKGLITVRLAGIDAPELRQGFGAASKQMLSGMLLGKTVGCESHKKDRYGRFVGKIEADGRDVGHSMIEKGGAWHYKKYQSEQSAADRARYSAAETSSRLQSTGLWLDSYIAPWDYRKNAFTATYVMPRVTRVRGLESGPIVFGNYGDSYNVGPYSGGSSTSSPSSGGTVTVKSYTRKDGTVVQGHTRSAPSKRPR